MDRETATKSQLMVGVRGPTFARGAMGIGAALAVLNSSRARATVRPQCALRQASLGVFCLGLVAGVQPLAGQDVELKRLSPTAYACKVLTADHVSRYSSITSALRSGMVGVQLSYGKTLFTSSISV